MVGPLSALEMTGISRDGRVTCRVSPTEAQPQPGPAGPLGVFRGALDRVLRQGSSMAHCPWADAWHPGGGGSAPKESHSQRFLLFPEAQGVRATTASHHGAHSCTATQLLAGSVSVTWGLYPLQHHCAPRSRTVPGTSPAGDPAATTRSTSSGTHTDSFWDVCIRHGVWGQGCKVPPPPAACL